MTNKHGFLKGNIPWNKGKKGVMPIPWNKGKPRIGEWKPCSYENCTNKVFRNPYKIKHNKTGKYYCSPKHQQKNQIWDKNPSFKKDDNISYVQIHRRVRSKRGKPENYPCAMQDYTCKGMMEWASISHHANPDIDDFIPLCRSHHRRYDLRNRN